MEKPLMRDTINVDEPSSWRNVGSLKADWCVCQVSSLAGIVLFLFVFMAPSRANDSMSELAAGGLILLTNDDIVMQKEDLYLSETEVRIRYEMRNDSQRSITARVAFPLPEVPHITPSGFTTSRGGYNIPIFPPTDPDLLNFIVTVNGKRLRPDVEIIAQLNGKNIAPDLISIGGMSLVLQPGEFIMDEAPISDSVKERLLAFGAFQQVDNLIYKLPWTTFVTFHWMQAFEPGVTIVEHRYRPIVGSHLVISPKGKNIQVSGIEDASSHYCFSSSVEKKIRDLAKVKVQNEPLYASTLGYVLKTGGNWGGRTIETFKLTISAAKQTQVTSLCTDLPLVKTKQNEFVSQVRNYRPLEDLNIIFIRSFP